MEGKKVNVFKNEIMTGDRTVAYINGKCFVRNKKGEPEILLVENFKLDELITYTLLSRQNHQSQNL